MSSNDNYEDKFKTWIYPNSKQYKIREYQLKICETAIFHNTLVCLPTGLGKTLLASVVMYNYYRWFPNSIIIFLAPTKPLVAQQMEACYNIMGLPELSTAHLEGSVNQIERKKLWNSKNVFFATPQTIESDLNEDIIDVNKISCLVFDEAHKATGNYSYNNLMKYVWKFNNEIRILALSATPATEASKLQSLINNLKITRIEIRTEDDPDIIPYIHDKQIEYIVCKGGYHDLVTSIKNKINDIITPYTKKLENFSLLTSGLSKYLNLMVINEAKTMLDKSLESQEITINLYEELNLTISISRILLECRMLLSSDDTNNISNYFDNLENNIYLKSCMEELKSNPSFEYIKQQLIQLNNVNSNNNSSSSIKYSKINKLKDILLDHFQRHNNAQSSTRAIVFSDLRTTVNDIVNELKKYNNLATSIAEEGLDIAEVDLIVLFDFIGSSSRFTQRIGRTGRKRAGRVIMLINEGKDESKLIKTNDSLIKMNKLLSNPLNLNFKQSDSARMIPAHLPLPQVYKQEMNVKEFNGSLISGSKWHSNSIPKSMTIDNQFKAILNNNNKSSTYNDVITIDNDNDVFGFDIVDGYHILPCDASRNISITKTIDLSSFSKNHNYQITNHKYDTNISNVISNINSISNVFTNDNKIIENMNENQIIQTVDYIDISADSVGKYDQINEPWFVETIIDNSNDIEMNISNNRYRKIQQSRINIQMKRLEVNTSASKSDVFHIEIPTVENEPIENGHSTLSSNQSQLKSSDSLSKVITVGNSVPFIMYDSDDEIIATQESQQIFDSININKIDDNKVEESTTFAKPPRPSARPIQRSDQQSNFKTSTREISINNMNTYSPIYDNSDSYINNDMIWSNNYITDSPTIIYNDDYLVKLENNIIDVSSELIDDLACSACLLRDSDDDNPILLCDGPCKQAIHMICFGLSTIPIHSFYCDRCSVNDNIMCCLCHQSNGLMRRSEIDRHYAHPCCVYFTPELTLSSTCRANNLSSLNSERSELTCKYCKLTGGAVVQCKYQMCYQAIHPFCVMNQTSKHSNNNSDSNESNQWNLIMRDSDNVTDALTYEIYCPKHVTVVDRNLVYSTLLLSIMDDKIPNSKILKLFDNNSDPMISLTQVVDCNTTPIHNKSHRRLVKSNYQQSNESIKKNKKRKKIDKEVIKYQKKRLVSKYFDEEASDDDESDNNDPIDPSDSITDANVFVNNTNNNNMHDSMNDFINDGVYTQSNSQTQGMSLYYQVDRKYMEANSPLFMNDNTKPINRKNVSKLKFTSKCNNLPLINDLINNPISYDSDSTTISSNKSIHIINKIDNFKKTNSYINKNDFILDSSGDSEDSDDIMSPDLLTKVMGNDDDRDIDSEISSILSSSNNNNNNFNRNNITLDDVNIDSNKNKSSIPMILSKKPINSKSNIINNMKESNSNNSISKESLCISKCNVSLDSLLSDNEPW